MSENLSIFFDMLPKDPKTEFVGLNDYSLSIGKSLYIYLSCDKGISEF